MIIRITEGNPMRRRRFAGLFFLVILLVLIVVPGCSTTKSLVQKIMPGKTPHLKKRVVVLPFVDYAGLGQESSAQITSDFVDLLKESPHLLTSDSTSAPSLFRDVRLSEFGLIAEPELIKKAGESGINAIITGVINPIETSTKKTGIIPFRKLSKIYEISMFVNVLDTSIGTLLSTNLSSGDDSVPLEEIQGQDEKDFAEQALRNVMSKILERQAESVIEELLKEPWTGKIVAADNSTLTINAAEAVGVQAGDRFEVFETDMTIMSSNGSSYQVLGKKIGDLKVTAVMERHSLAAPVKEGPFMPGQIIRFKP
ncbi:MAG: hypothetical protein U9N82_10075 [Thermodesulfobacteriota bacterium]|nr:hypothetical protein [Thermodesulfobacteriota bacterium]